MLSIQHRAFLFLLGRSISAPSAAGNMRCSHQMACVKIIRLYSFYTAGNWMKPGVDNETSGFLPVVWENSPREHPLPVFTLALTPAPTSQSNEMVYPHRNICRAFCHFLCCSRFL